MSKRTYWMTTITLGILVLVGLGGIFYEDIQYVLGTEAQEDTMPSLYSNRSLPLPYAKKGDTLVKVQKPSYEKTIEQVIELTDNGFFQKAALELSDLIRRFPERSEAYLLLGEIYLHTEDWTPFDRLMTRIETKFPGEQAQILRIKKWIHQGQFSTVLALTESVGDLSPEMALYRMILLSLQNDHKGAKAIAVGSTKQAVGAYYGGRFSEWGGIYEGFSVIKDGKNAHLFALFAKTLAEWEEPLLAQHFADQAIKDETDYIDAWVLRGYSFFLRQNYQQAKEDFLQARRLDPTRAETNYFLGLASYELGEYQEAAGYLQSTLSYEGFPLSEKVRWTLIDIFSQQKKYDLALEMYESLLDSEADPQKFISAIDIAVNILGQPEKALTLAKSLVEKDPDSIFLNNLYAWALIAQKDYFNAQKVLEQQLEKDKTYARTYLNLGLLYEEQQKFTKAREYYKQCYIHGQDDPALVSVVRLASDRYNALLHKEDRPEEQEVVTDRSEHSP